MEKALDVEVKQLLNARRGSWQQVAEAADVSYSWLSKFARGKIENPGYATLVRLQTYLKAPAAQEA